jgi:hypothetical protein
MDLPSDLPDPNPVDDDRRAKLMLAAAMVLLREGSTPLERRWASEVYDLCAALGRARDEQA